MSDKVYGQSGFVEVPKGFFMASYKDSGQIGDKIIRLSESGTYSHTELVFSTLIRGVNNCASASWRDGKVRYNRIDFSTGKWDFTPLDPKLETHAIAVFNRAEGLDYDYLGVSTFPLMYLVPGWRTSKHKFFCSEICGEALGLIGRNDRLGPSMLTDIMASIAKQNNLKLTY